jgi:hypothetical protein
MRSRLRLTPATILPFLPQPQYILISGHDSKCTDLGCLYAHF